LKMEPVGHISEQLLVEALKMVPLEHIN
jgi:hypothetical protein